MGPQKSLYLENTLPLISINLKPLKPGTQLPKDNGTFLCCRPKKWHELLCFPGKEKKGAGNLRKKCSERISFSFCRKSQHKITSQKEKKQPQKENPGCIVYIEG